MFDTTIRTGIAEQKVVSPIQDNTGSAIAQGVSELGSIFSQYQKQSAAAAQQQAKAEHTAGQAGMGAEFAQAFDPSIEAEQAIPSSLVQSADQDPDQRNLITIEKRLQDPDLTGAQRQKLETKMRSQTKKIAAKYAQMGYTQKEINQARENARKNAGLGNYKTNAEIAQDSRVDLVSAANKAGFITDTSPQGIQDGVNAYQAELQRDRDIQNAIQQTNYEKGQIELGDKKRTRNLNMANQTIETNLRTSAEAALPSFEEQLTLISNSNESPAMKEERISQLLAQVELEVTKTSSGMVPFDVDGDGNVDFEVGGQATDDFVKSVMAPYTALADIHTKYATAGERITASETERLKGETAYVLAQGENQVATDPNTQGLYLVGKTFGFDKMPKTVATQGAGAVLQKYNPDKGGITITPLTVPRLGINMEGAPLTVEEIRNEGAMPPNSAQGKKEQKMVNETTLGIVKNGDSYLDPNAITATKSNIAFTFSQHQDYAGTFSKPSDYNDFMDTYSKAEMGDFYSKHLTSEEMDGARTFVEGYMRNTVYRAATTSLNDMIPVPQSEQSYSYRTQQPTMQTYEQFISFQVDSSGKVIAQVGDTSELTPAQKTLVSRKVQNLQPLLHRWNQAADIMAYTDGVDSSGIGKWKSKNSDIVLGFGGMRESGVAPQRAPVSTPVNTPAETPVSAPVTPEPRSLDGGTPPRKRTAQENTRTNNGVTPPEVRTTEVTGTEEEMDAQFQEQLVSEVARLKESGVTLEEILENFDSQGFSQGENDPVRTAIIQEYERTEEAPQKRYSLDFLNTIDTSVPRKRTAERVTRNGQ